jgi:hypothetical protein
MFVISERVWTEKLIDFPLQTLNTIPKLFIDLIAELAEMAKKGAADCQYAHARHGLNIFGITRYYNGWKTRTSFPRMWRLGEKCSASMSQTASFR